MTLTEKAIEAKSRKKPSEMSADVFKVLQNSMYQEFLQNSGDRDVAKAMEIYTELNEDQRKIFLDLVAGGK